MERVKSSRQMSGWVEGQMGKYWSFAFNKWEEEWEEGWEDETNNESGWSVSTVQEQSTERFILSYILSL